MPYVYELIICHMCMNSAHLALGDDACGALFGAEGDSDMVLPLGKHRYCAHDVIVF